MILLELSCGEVRGKEEVMVVERGKWSRQVDRDGDGERKETEVAIYDLDVMDCDEWDGMRCGLMYHNHHHSNTLSFEPK